MKHSTFSITHTLPELYYMNIYFLLSLQTLALFSTSILEVTFLKLFYFLLIRDISLLVKQILIFRQNSI